jgi:hypothetical protein
MYFRASTWSKYSRDPIGAGEWRILQGRLFQYSRTRSIEVPLNVVLWLVIAFVLYNMGCAAGPGETNARFASGSAT